ncbi:MAG: transposase [Desulfobacter sp.]|nr:transposase [Desulfobacter sp.]
MPRVDGLKGLPRPLRDHIPDTEVQLCVVHQIRNSRNTLVLK